MNNWTRRCLSPIVPVLFQKSRATPVTSPNHTARTPPPIEVPSSPFAKEGEEGTAITNQVSGAASVAQRQQRA